MFVSLTTIRAGDSAVGETARMAAESMLDWLRQFDGYKGLLVLGDPESGSARVMTFWESREAADRSARGRAQVRDTMIDAAGVELESTELYELVLDDRA